MKNKALIPAAAMVAVFCVGAFLQPYSLIRMENRGLFLLTPDWLREVLSGPHPVSEPLASLLVQFYDLPLAGALISAAIVTLTYLALSFGLKRTGLPFHRLVALAAALGVWFFTAQLESNLLPVMLLLIATAAALLSLLLGKKEGKSAPRWELPAAVILTVCVAVLIGFRPGTTLQERRAKALVNTRLHRWDKVLEAASPATSAADPQLLPYAFLALGETGTLGDRLFRYPVSGPEDFGMEGDNSPEACLFNSLLSECLHLPNEAIHQIFQYSAHLPHGMSHLSLYQLIKYNIEKGDYTLARKYARILERNPKGRRAARAVLKAYASTPDVADTAGHSSAFASVLTKDPVLNLALTDAEGLGTALSANRILCYQLLYGNLEGFQRLMESASWPGGRIPVHFQEALLIAGTDASTPGIDQATVRRFNAFSRAVLEKDKAAIQQAADGTYWGYYLMIRDRMPAQGDADAAFPGS